MNIALVYVMTSLISIAILGVWPIMLELMAEIVYPRGCEIAVCCMFAGVSFAGGVFSIVVRLTRVHLHCSTLQSFRSCSIIQ